MKEWSDKRQDRSESVKRWTVRTQEWTVCTCSNGRW